MEKNELERLIDDMMESLFENCNPDGSVEDWVEWVMESDFITDSDYDNVVTYLKDVMSDEDWSFYDNKEITFTL